MFRLSDYFAVLGLDYKALADSRICGRLIQRFPESDWPEFPFVESLEQICMPCGWELQRHPVPPSFFVAHLTSLQNTRYYAACCTFYEAKLDKNDQIKQNGFIKSTMETSQLLSSNMYSSRSSSIDSALPFQAALQHIANGNDEIVEPPEHYVPKSLVLIAQHEHFDLLKNCLSIIYTIYSNADSAASIESIIAAIIGYIKVPYNGGQVLSFSLNVGDTQFIQPPRSPSIPVTRNSVANLFRYLGINNVLTIFCAIIKDCKVVLCSHSLTRLAEGCSAFCSILYPLKYEYPYVPTLSRSLIDYCDSPTPFLYGVHSSSIDLIPDIKSVFIADLDCGCVHYPLPEKGGTAPQLPQPYLDMVLDDLYKILSPDLLTADQLYPLSNEKDFKEESKSRRSLTLGHVYAPSIQTYNYTDMQTNDAWKDKLLRAVFSKLFAQLFTGYRSCLYITRIHPTPVIHFDDALFLMLRKINQDNEFFQGLLGSARFHSFIQERGSPFRICDLFDDTYQNVKTFQNSCTCSLNLKKRQNDCLIKQSRCITNVHGACPFHDNEDVSNNEASVILSQNIEKVATIFFENEYPNYNIPKHIVPEQAEQAHKRIHLPAFPLLDVGRFQEELLKCTERQKLKNEPVFNQPEPRFVPQGHFLDRQIFRSELNTDKYRVICGFVQDIFSHHITEALKRRNTIRQDLRFRPFRRMFIDELHQQIFSNDNLNKNIDTYSTVEVEQRSSLTWDQFELIVDLIDEALKHEAQSENTGIHAPIMELCCKFFTQLNSERYYMNMTTQIQRYEIWSKKTFWTSIFNEQMNLQIRSFYIYESEHQPTMDSPTSMSYAYNMSALEIAAEEIRLAPTRPKDFQETLVRQEEQLMYSHLIDFTNKIIAFHIPVRAGSKSRNISANIEQVRETSDFNEQSVYMLGNGPFGGIDSNLCRSEDIQQIVHRLESMLRSFVAQLVRDNNLPPIHCETFRNNITELIDFHLSNMEKLYPEVRIIPKWKKPEVTNPELLANEVVIKMGGQNFVSCQLLADGRLEKVEWQPLDMENLRTLTNQTASLASNLEPNGAEVELDTLMLPLLPAQGALFLTNYRIIFSGVPSDPYQSNKVIRRSFPISALLKVDALGQQRIVTHLPAAPGGSFIFGEEDLHNFLPKTETSSPLNKTKPSRLPRFRKGNNEFSNLVIGGLIKKEENLDVIRLQAFSGLQLLRLAFDPNEVSQAIRCDFKNLLMILRYPKALSLGFNPVTLSGGVLPTGAQISTSFDDLNEDVTCYGSQKTDFIYQTGYFSTMRPLSPKTIKQTSSRFTRDRLSATMKGVIGSSSTSNSQQLIVARGVNCPPRNSLQLSTDLSNFLPLSITTQSNLDDESTFQRNALRVTIISSKRLSNNPTLLEFYLNQYSYVDMANFIFDTTYEQKDNGKDYSTPTDPQLCFADNTEYTICQSYPAMLIVPKGFNEMHLKKVAKNYSQARFPVITWRNPKNKAYLLRGSGFCGKNFISQIKSTASQATAQTTGEPIISSSKELVRYLQALVDISPKENSLSNNYPTSSSGVSSSFHTSQSLVNPLNGAGNITISQTEANNSSVASLEDIRSTNSSLAQGVNFPLIQRHPVNRFPPSHSNRTQKNTKLSRSTSILQAIARRTQNIVTRRVRQGIQIRKYASLSLNPSHRMRDIDEEVSLDSRLSLATLRPNFHLQKSPQRLINKKLRSHSMGVREDPIALESFPTRNQSSIDKYSLKMRAKNNSINDDLSASSIPFSCNIYPNNISLYIIVEKSKKSNLGKMDRFPGVAFIFIDTIPRTEMKKAFKALFTACIPDRVRSTGWIQDNVVTNDLSSGTLTSPQNPGTVSGSCNGVSNNQNINADILQSVHESKWLQQIQNLLQVAGCVVDFIEFQDASVAICLEDGWDNVPQITSLVQVMLDSNYRTIKGFWTLVEKEWLTFGHQFSQRSSQTVDTKASGYSPVFLQFLDAVHQLVRQFPLAFEFNDFYLQFLAYHHVSNRFADFKLNSENERIECWLKMEWWDPNDFQARSSEDSLKKALLALNQNSIYNFITSQHHEWPIFFNFRYDFEISCSVLRPATKMAALDLWDYYLSEDLESGPIYDLDHFSPSYRKQNPREYEPIIRQGFNNSHVEQTYALLGLREGHECANWFETWKMVQEAHFSELRTNLDHILQHHSHMVETTLKRQNSPEDEIIFSDLDEESLHCAFKWTHSELLQRYFTLQCLFRPYVPCITGSDTNSPMQTPIVRLNAKEEHPHTLQLDEFRVGMIPNESTNQFNNIGIIKNEFLKRTSSLHSLTDDSEDQISLGDPMSEDLYALKPKKLPERSYRLEKDPLRVKSLCRNGVITSTPLYSSQQARLAALEEHRKESLELLRSGGCSQAQINRLFVSTSLLQSMDSDTELPTSVSINVQGENSGSSQSSSQFGLNIPISFVPESQNSSTVKLLSSYPTKVNDETFFDEIFITKHNLVPLSKMQVSSEKCHRCKGRRPDMQCTSCNVCAHEKCLAYLDRSCNFHVSTNHSQSRGFPSNTSQKQTTINTLNQRLAHITERDEFSTTLDFEPSISAPFDLMHKNGYSDLSKTLSNSQKCPGDNNTLSFDQNSNKDWNNITEPQRRILNSNGTRSTEVSVELYRVSTLDPLDRNSSIKIGSHSMPPHNFERGIYRSYLYKLTNNRMLPQQWHHIFFVLDSTRNQLQYFESRESQIPRGCIEIQDVLHVDILSSALNTAGHKFPAGCVLEITTNSRKFRLASEESDLIKNWQEKLRHQMS